MSRDIDRPSPALVEAELVLIAASAGFRRSARHVRFLRHLVAATLSGDVARLREMALGLEVFLRNPSRFDPRRDTIVRVEARRLRQKLQAYYAEEGQDARLEFALPVGGYLVDIKRRDRSSAATRPRSSVAVFELLALGADAHLVAAAAGLSAELAGALARLNGLRVVAAGAAPAGPSVAELKRASRGLNVASIVLGTVARHGPPDDPKLGIELRLVHAEDGALMWSRRAVFEPGLALEGLEPLARGIISVLHRQAALLQLQRIRLAGSRPLLPGLANGGPTPAALERLSLARVAMRSNSLDGYRKATAMAEAVALELPSYAPAFVALSQALMGQVGMTALPSEPSVEAARRAAERALELQPELADAHAQLGGICHSFDRDWPLAEAHLLAALRFAPALPLAHAAYGFALMMNRRFEEAHAAYAQARELDSIALLYRAHEALISIYEHDWERAAQGLDALLEVAPDHLIALALRAALHLYAGEWPQGQQAYVHISERFPKLSLGCCGLAQAHALLGQRAQAVHELAKLKAIFDAGYASPYQIAMVHARLDEPEQALHWLAQSARLHDYNFICTGVDPAFDGLRDHPAFDALLASNGLGHMARN